MVTTTRQFEINDISAVTYHSLVPFQYNLITEADEKWLQVAYRRGAVESLPGGDEFKAAAIIAGGLADKEYDPADENPSTTFHETGEQTLTNAQYKMFVRARNVNWSTELPELNMGPGALANALSIKLRANMMDMVENLIDNGSSPGGFWQASQVLPGSGGGITNAHTCFVDQDGDFGEIDVSTYTKWKPAKYVASNSVSANLISQDLTGLLNACDRQAEGFPTDIFTNQTIWEKIVALKAAKNVASTNPAFVDFGARNTTDHAGIPIHWSRHIPTTTSTFWDEASTTPIASHPIIAVDFSAFHLRLRRGGGMPGDERALIQRVGPTLLHPTKPFFFQRIRLIAQWYFQRTRRTSGHMGGVKGTS